MTTIGVSGAAGRMGMRILTLANEDPDLQVTAAIERPEHPDLGKDAGEIAGIGPIGVLLSEKQSSNMEVLIDFSSPQSTLARLRSSVKNGTNMVTGTTGLTDEINTEIKDAAKSVALLASPNMSVGVNLLFNLVGEVAAALGEDFDVEIVEAHHRFKKDAPSGTALRLGECIAEALGRDLSKDGVHGRFGQVGERTTNEIGMHAIRGGDIVGEHTVYYAALGERIEVRHVAQSRDTFVRGAIRAAKFLAHKKPGLYTMDDVLGLKS